MAFNGLFTISQGTDATTFSIQDTSTGSDPNITDRRIFLNLYDGTTLTPPNNGTPYIDWPLSDGSSITLTGILPRDYAINIVVQWISSNPLAPPSTYTFTLLNDFVANTKLFAYGLSEMQSGNPLLINDNGYFQNKSKLLVLIQDSLDAVAYNDQTTAQLCLNDAYDFIQNQKTFF